MDMTPLLRADYIYIYFFQICSCWSEHVNTNECSSLSQELKVLHKTGFW